MVLLQKNGNETSGSCDSNAHNSSINLAGKVSTFFGVGDDNTKLKNWKHRLLMETEVCVFSGQLMYEMHFVVANTF